MARRLKLRKDFSVIGIFIPAGAILFDYQWATLIGRGDGNFCGNMIDLTEGSSDNQWWGEIDANDMYVASEEERRTLEDELIKRK